MKVSSYFDVDDWSPVFLRYLDPIKFIWYVVPKIWRDASRLWS